MKRYIIFAVLVLDTSGLPLHAMAGALTYAIQAPPLHQLAVIKRQKTSKAC